MAHRKSKKKKFQFVKYIILLSAKILVNVLKLQSI